MKLNLIFLPIASEISFFLSLSDRYFINNETIFLLLFSFFSFFFEKFLIISDLIRCRYQRKDNILTESAIYFFSLKNLWRLSRKFGYEFAGNTL